jgi:hypothetical protein
MLEFVIEGRISPERIDLREIILRLFEAQLYGEQQF